MAKTAYLNMKPTQFFVVNGLLRRQLFVPTDHPKWMFHIVHECSINWLTLISERLWKRYYTADSNFSRKYVSSHINVFVLYLFCCLIVILGNRGQQSAPHAVHSHAGRYD